MVKEFIGICGPSGVGKKTLVEALRDNKQDLRERFGIPADARVDTFAAGFGPLHDKHAEADYLVWKWQKNNNHLLQELSEQFPDCRHRLICLWLPPELHYQRMLHSNKSQHRTEAEGKSADRLAKSFIKDYMPRFRDNADLQRLGISVELVDSSTPRYDPAKWPEPK